MTERFTCEIPDGLTRNALLKALEDAEMKAAHYQQELMTLTIQCPEGPARYEHTQRMYKAAYMRAGASFAAALIMKALATGKFVETRNKEPHTDA